MRSLVRFAFVLVLSALGAGASAQGPAQPRDPNMPDPKNTIPEKMAPQDPNATGSTGESLSDRLERTEGVITPRSTGPSEAVIPPARPNPDSMPVIRPPGTSPSDPVQPK
jgi:hypothetical protein